MGNPAATLPAAVVLDSVSPDGVASAVVVRVSVGSAWVGSAADDGDGDIGARAGGWPCRPRLLCPGARADLVRVATVPDAPVVPETRVAGRRPAKSVWCKT
ncbi:MAG: hypothetical protein AAF281_17005 [Pseudomonadota bacterium]